MRETRLSPLAAGSVMRPAAAISLAVLLAWAIYAAAQRGLADVEYFAARRVMARWSVPPQPTDGEWISARRALEAARAREPDNPLYVEELGRAYEWRALGRQSSSPEARAALERSLEQYRAAARMRPGSPFAWANIALIKFRLDDLDYEFYGALDRAERMGPWEPAVQRTFADIGLAGWPLLARPGKEVVGGAIERGLLMQEDSIKRIAARHGHTREFCADPIAKERRVGALCASR